jgi:hypothetical protein
MEFVGDVVIVWPVEDAAAHSVELLGMDDAVVIGFEEQSDCSLAAVQLSALRQLEISDSDHQNPRYPSGHRC